MQVRDEDLPASIFSTKSNFVDSAALNHPNFWKNYLEAADAIRLIVELGWPIPPSFEDTLIHVFSHFTSTTPSIVEHTRCAILRALGGHMSTTSYMECCVQLCLKHAGALLTIAERHTSDSKKVDSSISLAVPNFVSNLLACCPLLVEVTWWTVRVKFFFGCANIFHLIFCLLQKLELPENIDMLTTLQKVCGRIPKWRQSRDSLIGIVSSCRSAWYHIWPNVNYYAQRILNECLETRV